MKYNDTKLVERDKTTLQIREVDWGLDDWEPNWSDNYRNARPPYWEKNSGILPKWINGTFVSGYYILTNVDEDIFIRLNIPIRHGRDDCDMIVDEEEFIILKLAGVFNVS